MFEVTEKDETGIFVSARWYTNGRTGREVRIACLPDRADKQTIEEVQYVRV
jgi:hypothetical protein